MPVWGIWVDGAFYFSTGSKSRKARNLARNRRCIVCNERADQAVIVEGVAGTVTDKRLITRLAGPYHVKYKPWKLDPAMGSIYVVRPRTATPTPTGTSLPSATPTPTAAAATACSTTRQWPRA
jgi:hypothetical protein